MRSTLMMTTNENLLGKRVKLTLHDKEEKGTVVKHMPEEELVSVKLDNHNNENETTTTATTDLLIKMNSVDFGQSLVEAINLKYKEVEEHKKYGISLFSRIPEINQIESLHLPGLSVSFLGDSMAFSAFSSKIKEIDLDNTLLSDWSIVVDLMTLVPNLKSLNLSRNTFKKETIKSVIEFEQNRYVEMKRNNKVPSIHTLVLNKTAVQWEEINSLLKIMENLQELHIYHNDLTTIEITEDLSQSLELIQLTKNKISNWSEVWKLRNLPNLNTLVLSENPLESIKYYPKTKDENGISRTPFISLKKLFLNKTHLSSWDDIDEIGSFPHIQELKIISLPWFENDTPDQEERRLLIIARVPSIQTLNGSPITQGERVEAEKYLIKKYTTTSSRNKPKLFDKLVSIHGTQTLSAVFVRGSTPKIEVFLVSSLLKEPQSMWIDTHLTVEQIRAMIARKYQWKAIDLSLLLCLKRNENEQIISLSPLNRRLLTFGVQTGDTLQVISSSSSSSSTSSS